jgi:D-hydroxyproline dehydrogenase subunit gamma
MRCDTPGTSLPVRSPRSLHRSIVDVLPIAMYRSLPDASGQVVTLTIEGKAVTVTDGVSVAAALMQTGTLPTRTSVVTQAPRAPYCMMGVCFECLVEIDGVPNRQACMETVAEGMQVRCQHGAAAVKLK